MKVLLTGADGMLARALVSSLLERSHDVAALSHAQLDVTEAARVHDVVMAERPDAIVQCAAYTRVDDAEQHEAAAYAVNVEGTLNVARACRAIGARFVYPSSDYVFDGRAHVPYAPEAEPAPLSAYGRTKLAGEGASEQAGDCLIVRTGWLYGAGGRHFVRTMVQKARAGETLRVVDDQRGAPTWTRDVEQVMRLLLEQQVPAGVYHATNAGDATWYELASAALELAGVTAPLNAVSSESFARGAATTAVRPHYSVLDCAATYAITGAAPHWRTALERAIAEGVHEC